MKIRFSENTIRLRLSEKDLEDLAIEKTVDFSTVFSPYDRLTFVLELWLIESPKASFENNIVKISIHEESFIAWKNSQEEGIYFTEAISDALLLNIAVEKDFPCKH